MSLVQRISLLTTAERIARQSEKWEVSAASAARPRRALQAKDRARGLRLVWTMPWALAKKIGNGRLLKMATLFTSEFLHWKGELSEASSPLRGDSRGPRGVWRRRRHLAGKRHDGALLRALRQNRSGYGHDRRSKGQSAHAQFSEGDHICRFNDRAVAIRDT